MIVLSPAARSETQAVECIFSGSGEVADMNTTLIKIEVERLGFAVAEGAEILADSWFVHQWPGERLAVLADDQRSACRLTADHGCS